MSEDRRHALSDGPAPPFGVLAEPPELSGPRVLLRPVRRADLADLMDMNGDPVVTRFLPYQTWTGPQDGDKWLERIEAVSATGTARQMVIQSKATQKAIGTVLVFRFEAASARAEIGYSLGRTAWGQGLMREALQLALSFCFNQAGLRRLEAEVNPLNIASASLLQRLGFVAEGRLRQRWVAKGQTYDSLFFGLLRDEWVPPVG